MLDFLDANVPDVQPSAALDEPLPPVAGVTDDGFCQCGCHHHLKKQASAGIQLTVDGEVLSLTQEQQALIRAWKEAAHG